MPTLTLFEHGAVEYDWSERDLRAIDRVNRSAGAEVLQAATRGASRILRAHQYVGVVRIGPTTVQILPKMHWQERAYTATLNLLTMLAYAGRLTLHEHHGLVPLLQRDLDWFEILTHLFAVHLAQEWQRGAHQGYEEVETELPVLKGKWRVAEQLRHPGQQHRLSVTYAEFGPDDALNRVLRYVVEQLWRVTRDDANRRTLSDLRVWMDGVTLLPAATAADAQPALITRLNRRFEPLLNLARVFLGQGALQLAAGELQTYSLVFDMNLIFQEFIVNFIIRHRGDCLPEHLQLCELLPQSRGAVQHLARHNAAGTAVFPLYPDLAFRSGERFPLLLDAKYKLLDPASSRLGVAPDDFYQMFIYAHRYHCPRVVLVYPRAEHGPALRHSFDVHASESVIEVATVDLHMDLRLQHHRLISELKAILANG